jgi:hypothetical protein
MNKLNILSKLTLILMVVFIISCQKKATDDPPNPGTSGGDVTTTNLVISSNVFVINDSIMQFDHYGSDEANGKYQYYCPNMVPLVGIGAILIDTLNGGMIRKVTDKTITNNYITFQTTQALLSDVFESGELSFTLDPGPSAPNLKSGNSEKTIVYKEKSASFSEGVTSPNKVDYNFDSEVAANVKLTGSFHTVPRIHFDFVFSKEKGVEKFSCDLAQTKLVLQSTLALNASGSAQYSIGKELCKIERSAMFWVYGVPVPMNMEFLMTAIGYVNFEEAANFPVTFTNTSTLGYGVTFENGQTTYTTGFTNSTAVSGVPSFNAKGQVLLSIVPQITIQFYGVLSNVIKPKPYVDLSAKYTNVGGTQQMCAEIDGGIDLGLGVSAGLFGVELFNLSKDFNIAKSVLWKSLEGCDIPKVTLSGPGYSPGSHECEIYFIPTTVTMNVDDPGHLLGPGTVLYSIYSFHVPGGIGNTGTIHKDWVDLTVNGNQLSYNICIRWEDADYVEQNVYLMLPDGTQSNVASILIERGGIKSGSGTKLNPAIL